MSRGKFIKTELMHRSVLSALWIATATALPAIVAPVEAQAQTTRAFDIPAQSLPDALIQFATQSGLQVATDGAVIQGAQTSGVKGSLPAASALSQLLRGTGFTFRINGTIVTIERAPTSAEGAIELGPVRVQGEQAGGSALPPSLTVDHLATEGSGSYAVKGASITKGELALKDIPQSVTVMTRQRLDDQNLDTLIDAMANVTGVTVDARVGGGSDFYSRGFQMSNVQFDGVPTYRSTSPSANMFNASTIYLDRVEVLRGSQGLLEGQGTPGGAVNLVRKRGTLDRQIGYVLRGGSWNHAGGQADLSGPINADKTLRLRAVVDYDRQDSYINYVNSKRFTGYLAADYDISPDTKLGVAAMLGRTHGIINLGLPVNSDGSDARLPRSTYLGAKWNYTNTDEEQYWADLEHRFSADWSFRIAANYSNARSDQLYLTPTAINQTTGTTNRTVWKSYDSARNLALDAHVDGQFDTGPVHNSIEVGGSLARINAYEFLEANFNYDTTSVTNPNADVAQPTSYAWSGTYRFKPVVQRGVYGVVRSTLGPATLILGGRVNWYRAVRATSSFSQNGTVVPFVGLVYKLTPQWSAYASYTDVYNPQLSLQANGDTLPPERGKAYEVGIKGELADGRVTTSLALFRTDQINLAVTDFASGEICSGNYCYLPSGNVRSQGVEAELNGEVLPGWQLSAGYTYNHTSHIEDFLNFISPRHALRLWSTYRLPGQLSHWSIGGGIRHQSAQARNTVRNDPFTVVSARLDYRLNEHANLSLNIENLLNATYYTTVGRNYYGAPRNFMVTLRGKI